jgi:hypothetical protein
MPSLLFFLNAQAIIAMEFPKNSSFCARNRAGLQFAARIAKMCLLFVQRLHAAVNNLFVGAALAAGAIRRIFAPQ